MAGLLGALVFLFFLIFLDAGILISVLCGSGGLVAGYFLFRTNKPMKVELGGPEAAELQEALKEGEAKLAALRAGAKGIKNAAVGAKVEGIAVMVKRVLDQIRKDPHNLRNARQFLGYYLDATGKIVARYAELSAQGLQDSDLQASLRRVEGMLDTIRAAFEKQLARLLSDDVLDLDTELGLLEKTIKMEGLGEDPK
jgi:5-bromo-4-chloroindolyl phosphate hydrolysis protein